MTAKKYLFIILISLLTVSTYSQAGGKSNGPAIAWIETLENGDSYNIEITSVGCFGGSRQNVTIFKEADLISAQLDDKTVQLSDADYKSIIDFENELRALTMGGCTTVDTYVLEYQGQKFQTSDGTCSWHGYRKIVALFE